MKFRLVDSYCRTKPEWTPEQDRRIGETMRVLVEWLTLDDKERDAWIERGMEVGLKRMDTDLDDPLCQYVWIVKQSIHKFQKLINTRQRQKERSKIRNPQEWSRLRYTVLAERGNKCECCGRSPPDVVIHVDHIKPVSKYPHLALDPDNLQILCNDCNHGKSAIDETDWRK